jgi:hypothetical protein
MKKETNALTPLDANRMIAVYSNEKDCDEFLEEIVVYAKSFVFDPDTTKGRKEIVAHAANIGRTIKALNDKGVELITPMKKEVQRINAFRRKIKETLAPVQKEIRRPVKEWEEERDRIQKKIEAIAEKEPRCERLQTPIEPRKSSSFQLNLVIQELRSFANDEQKLAKYGQWSKKAKQAALNRAEELEQILEITKEKEALENKIKQEERERQLINKIKNYDYSPIRWANAELVKSMIEKLESIVVDNSYGEREKEARLLKIRLLSQLQDGYKKAKTSDHFDSQERSQTKKQKTKENEAVEDKQKEEKNSFDSDKAFQQMKQNAKTKSQLFIQNKIQKAFESKGNYSPGEANKIVNILLSGIPHVTIDYKVKL